MINLRPNPKAVSSYSDQAQKARLRDQVNLLFQKLFYYRPIDGEERQLDKKKLLFIGISFLSIAFVTSYIPYVGDWFSKTIQPALPFQQQQTVLLPELAPELLLQEIPKAIEGVSPVDDASDSEGLVDEALKPEGDGDFVTSLDDEEEEPLNILDYLFKAEDIKVEEAKVPAPVPAPIADDDIVIDPFPIEAMPPEIRAQLGNSPPLEELMGESYRPRQTQTNTAPVDLDESYRGKTGVFRSADRDQNQLNIYADNVQVGSSLQLERPNTHALSFHEALSPASASLHLEGQGSSTSVFRAQPSSQTTQVFRSTDTASAATVFQSALPNSEQSTVFQDVPSPPQAASYRAVMPDNNTLTRYQAQGSSAGHYSVQVPDNSSASLRIEAPLPTNLSVYQSPSELNSVSSFRETTTPQHAQSYQAETGVAKTISVAASSTSSNPIRVYSDQSSNNTQTGNPIVSAEKNGVQEFSNTTVFQQTIDPIETTIFAERDLVGGSSFKRAIEAEEVEEIDLPVQADIVEVIQESVEGEVIQEIKEASLDDYLNPGDQIEARLVTGAILVANSSQPIVAKAKADWCAKQTCPDLVFIGEASYKSGNRAELQFNQVVFDGKAQQAASIAIGADKSIGVPVALSDTTPTLAQDLARGALSGVAAYANALVNQKNIIDAGDRLIEQSAVPSIENFVLGNLAKLFATQPEQTAVVRIAELKADTPLSLIYGINERNSYERYTTPYRFSN